MILDELALMFLTSELNKRIKYVYKAQNITIPFGVNY